MDKPVFCCPICKKPLTDEKTSLRCEKGHSFDKAAQGYVHLLPSSKMKTKLPGDSREMVEARRRFLDTEIYAPFKEEAARLLLNSLAGIKKPVVLDAGCGEGYYTDYIAKEFEKEKRDFDLFGIDISKNAVKSAAKRNRQINLAVASCFDLPVCDNFADALVSIFSPIAQAEFKRVVRPGGYLLIAVAGERHLFGLKEVLYEHPYENEHKKTEYDGFKFVSRTHVRSVTHLTSQQQIADLFTMTPYYWKTPVDGAKRLSLLDSLDTEIGFDFLLYRREG